MIKLSYVRLRNGIGHPPALSFHANKTTDLTLQDNYVLIDLGLSQIITPLSNVVEARPAPTVAATTVIPETKPKTAIVKKTKAN